MWRVKIQKIGKGMHSSEVVVGVATADGGREDLIVDQRSLMNNMMLVGSVARKKNQILIELPQESLRGLWRVWVDKSLVKAAGGFRPIPAR